MPRQTPSASDYTSVVKSSAVANDVASKPAGTPGAAKAARAAVRGGGGLASLGAIGSIVKHSTVAKSNTSPPLRVVVTPKITVGNAVLGTDYTITNANNGRTYYNFLATGKTMTVTTDISVLIDYLAIGGGGGGGGTYGGGGGAGGLQQASSYFLPAGTYNVVIGSGGIGGNTGSTIGTKGTNTTFGAIVTAQGGGGGSAAFNPPSSGGCGGGGGFSSYADNGNGVGALGTQGGRGGNGGTGGNNSAGGGGGVGGDGENTLRARGGVGISYNNGTLLQLGGGGGGTGNNPGTGGVGRFGGGNGARVVSTEGPTSGSANTGGGGGGAYVSGESGGTGGSGIFILSYAS